MHKTNPWERGVSREESSATYVDSWDTKGSKVRAGAQIITTVYVIRGAKESLLGLRDGEALGRMKIKPEGEKINRLQMMTTEAAPLPGTPKSGDETQGQIDQKMGEI